MQVPNGLRLNIPASAPANTRTDPSTSAPAAEPNSESAVAADEVRDEYRISNSFALPENSYRFVVPCVSTIFHAPETALCSCAPVIVF